MISINFLAVKDWYWDEGMTARQIVRRLTEEHAMMHVDAVRLLEEAEIQDGEIGDSLYYLSLEDAIRVLDDAGWAPERIYSTLTSQWCGCVPPLAIAAMRFTLGLRWQQLLDISGMHIDEFVDRMDEQMRYDISTRFFVRVWPDPEVCHSDCFEEARLERFEEAKAVAEELFDRLGKKLKDKYVGGVTRGLWHIRVAFEDALGEERIPGGVHGISREEEES